MTRGGRRIRSGPAPDPNALRRDRATDREWTTLPAGGRKGRAPAWPLTKASARERSRWVELWKRPQAVVWEQLQMHDQVALYVRRWCEAEKPDSSTALSTLVRQMADSLGLTIPGMLSLRWRVSDDEVAAARASTRAPAATSGRERLKAIAGGQDA